MKQKSPQQLQESINFYRIIVGLLIVLGALIVFKYESENISLTQQLTSEVNAYDALYVKWRILDDDVVDGTCLRRSQL